MLKIGKTKMFKRNLSKTGRIRVVTEMNKRSFINLSATGL